ncbi:MAG TPA: helicase HerA-like domain-containing protein [Chitinophagaceae bacterium]|nr:helicase HerA-like domain-containing protein [Chitinophagaceae bacterium]
MATGDQFLAAVNSGYAFAGETIKIGNGMLDGAVIPGATVYLPLKMLNRHGLIAGATGTGKTKTLQLLSEGLSNASVPVLVLDIKGDLSGLGAAGTANPKLEERAQKLGSTYTPQAFPVELLTLSAAPGLHLRATVSEFGPVLLSKILSLNDTQASIVSLIFKYCDDNKLPLLDLKDFIKVLQYVTAEGKAEIEKTYGKISTTSTGTILRKVIELQQQGADSFFGERSFEVDDLMRISDDGRGMISILRVTELQDRPKLFSTFMLQLLAELYATAPEEGDLDKPKLVLFIDEAHLLFNEASQVLLDQMETIIKLIRSKGIGLFFCTQNPMDVPPAILSQLGMKVQHALRAFTAADRKTIKQAAENYPETTFYKTENLLTELGIGEALVTVLNERGIPTPLVHTMLLPPLSRMDVLSSSEVETLARHSKLAAKYNTVVDSQSAYEILNEKIAQAALRTQEKEAPQQDQGRTKKEESWMDNPMVRSAGRTAATMITRSLLGVLGLGGSTRRRSRSLF